MSSCEKCWTDSQDTDGDSVKRYGQLIKTRYCTAEEQAGPRAGECPVCHRMTLHQYTSEPMCRCDLLWLPPGGETP